MNHLSEQVQQVHKIVEQAKSNGIAHLVTHELSQDGRNIQVNGRNLVNFASCSYLGLETDERLKQGAKEVIDNFGVASSSSRSYLGIQPIEDLEILMAEIFGHPALVMPSTTMAHFSLIPLLIGAKDVMILDHQVHSSVQLASQIAKANGAFTEKVRHNRMDELESRIKKLQGDYTKIWYLADGVYSMFGDVAPMEELIWLLDKYENFYLYIDDAHGMSWQGKNGAGYVLSQVPYHEKMSLVTSLYKGFGSGGAAMVFRDDQQKKLVKNCGGTFMFSGPLHNGTVGAALASARIHLTPEIDQLQDSLRERIRFFRNKAHELGLPVISLGNTPIFYIGVGKLELGIQICKKMMASGFLTDIAAFPSVPLKNTGIRAMVNLHHSLDDIENLLTQFSLHLKKGLHDFNDSISSIHKAFKIKHLRNNVNGRHIADIIS